MIKSEDLRLGQPRVLETDNNLILPVNKWIRLIVTGVNVIHSFGVQSLGLRFDGIPGRLNSVSFQFARVGFFRGACMELCGMLHAYMPIKILGVDEINLCYIIVNISKVRKGNLAKFTREKESVGEFYV